MKVLPNDWEWKELGDVLEIIRNGTPSKQNKENVGIPVTRIETIAYEKINLDRVGYIENNPNIVEKFKLYKGDILFSHINSVEHIGKTALYDGFPEILIHGVNLLLLRSNKKVIIPEYLHYFLITDNTRNYYKAKCKRAVNQSSLNQGEITKLVLPIPPLPIQAQIVAILEKAERLKEKREQANQETNKIIQSVFYEMFGDPIRNEKSFDIEKLGSLTHRITKGESPKWQGFDYQEEGIPFITSENVLWGTLNIGKLKYIPSTFHEKLKRSKLEVNDVLVNLVGASIGRSCIVPNYISPANVNQAVAVISLTGNLNPNFLLYLLLSESCQRILKSNIVDAARANISLTDLNKLDIPVPPIELQNKFASIVEKVESLKERQRQSTQEINTLFDALLQKAFNGELVA